ncbi:MAG: hypothetical protein MSA09_13140 [Lachnospiraceae bacterium]|nr:hypothetical protein [Lachnospiraceae bacterium]
MTIELLARLSFQSVLGINLKKNLHYFDKDSLISEIKRVNAWYDEFEELHELALELRAISEFRIADMMKGKAKDDGYRGVHVYYQLDGNHYPIEIQYNTYYDRQFNNWLHKYVYKKNYENEVGLQLRNLYEHAKIQTEQDFKEAMTYVLSNR